MTHQQTISKEYIASFLPTNPIILEAGAHIGRDTVKMAQLWPTGTIYAFEPVPALFEQLQKNTADFPQVHCYPSALSATTGIQQLYISSGRSTACSSLLEPAEIRTEHPTLQFHTQNVHTSTIDAWAAQEKVTQIDFMWLDMQGAELAALQGAQRILPTLRAVLTEISLVHRYKDNPLYPQLSAWLATHGFTLAQETVRKKTWGEALFIRTT